MKNSISWIYNNFILFLFLGVQAFVLLFGMTWATVTVYEKHFPPKKEKKSINIYAESLLQDDLQWEIAQYKQAMFSDDNIQLKSLSQEESIQKFISNETDMIFISRPLHEKELNQIDTLRLPVSQENISVGNDSISQKVFLIHDNNYPAAEQSIANALVKKNILRKVPG